MNHTHHMKHGGLIMKDFWQANDESFFTEKQLRAVIPIPQTTFSKMRSTKELTYFKLGGRYQYQKKDVLDWLERSKVARVP
jgi:hypothetical protein